LAEICIKKEKRHENFYFYTKKLSFCEFMHVGYKQCSGSEMFIPNFFHHGYRIRIKEFKYFNTKKWFLSSRKYDPGCSSRIRILICYPSRIQDPGGQKGTGSRIRIRNTGYQSKRHCLIATLRYLRGEIAEEVLQAVLHVVGQPARHPVQLFRHGARRRRGEAAGRRQRHRTS
jgi:hypothetical protein